MGSDGLLSGKLDNSIVRRSLMLLFFVFPAYVFNYLFLIVAQRLLPTETFGILYTGISFTNILLGPSAILSLFFARRITIASARAGRSAAAAEFHAMVRYTVRYGFAVALVLLFMMLLFSSLLHVESLLLAVAIVATAYAIYIAETTRAAFQGYQRFAALGLETLVWMMLRFGLGIGGLCLVGSVWAGFLGIGLAALVIFAVFYFFVAGDSAARGASPGAWERDDLRKLSYFVAGFALLMGMMYLDNIMAYLTLSRLNVGLYSSASVLAKAVLIVTTPIIQVFFPVMVERSATGRAFSVTDVVKTLGTTVLISGSLAVFIYAFPEFLASKVLGTRQYDAGVLRAVAVSTVPLSVLRVFVVLQLSQGRDRHPLFLLPVVALQILYLRLNSGSLPDFAWAFALSCWAGMVYYGLLCLPKRSLQAVQGKELRQDINR